MPIRRFMLFLVIALNLPPMLYSQESAAPAGVQPDSLTQSDPMLHDTVSESVADTAVSAPVNESADMPVSSDTVQESSNAEDMQLQTMHPVEPESASVVANNAPVDTSEKILSLDKMVVSATRTRRKMSETSASVSVITSKEIEISPAKDINDLVANKTGVQVRRVVGMGEGVPSDISMRGIPGALAAARTLILVDGIPTNASGTPFLILNEIPVDIIESIEIVRGPYSSLYGANAFGGVINVITKKGAGKPSQKVMFENSYPFSTLEAWLDDERISKAAKTGARQSLWNGDILSSGGNEKFHYLFNAGYRTIGNYLLSDSALVKKNDVKYNIPAENFDYKDLRLFSKFGWKFDEKLSVDIHTRYFRSDLGFGVTRYSADTVDIDIKGEKFVVGPQVTYKLSDKTELKAGGYLRHVNGSYMNEMNSKPVFWKSSSNDWQLDLQGVARNIPGHMIMIGSEFLSNKINFGNLKNTLNDSVLSDGVADRISNAGAYIQDEILVEGKYRVTPGVRMDYHTLFGVALSPKLGLLVPLSNTVRLKGSAGRAFRAPNHTELFMPPIPLKDSIPLVSNSALDPEYIWAFDGGFDVTPLPTVKIQGGLFYNRMQDLIGQGIVLTDEFEFYVTHQNISAAWSAGTEFECEWRISSSLDLKAGYVYQQSRNESASEIAAYFKKKKIGLVKETEIELDYIPNHKGSIGVSYTRTFGRLKVSCALDEMVVGSRHYLNFQQIRIGNAGSDVSIIGKEVKVAPPYEKLPAYARTDVMLRADMGRFYAALAIQNCFNAEYEESYATLAPGMLASIRLGMQW